MVRESLNRNVLTSAWASMAPLKKGRTEPPRFKEREEDAGNPLRALRFRGKSPLSSKESASLHPRSLTGFIALAALTEFLGLRLLIRLGPLAKAMPHDMAATLAEGLIALGSVMLNLTLLLTLAALIGLAWQTSRRALRFSLVAVAALAVALTFVGSRAPPLLFAAFVLAVLAAMGIALGAARRPCRRPGWLALFGLAYLTLAYPTLGATLQRALPFTPNAHALSELFATLAAALTPLALRPRFDWRALAVGVGGASLLAGLWFGVPWLPATLMIWSVAFTGYLPMPVYVLALGLFLYALVALALDHDARRLAWGLALIALGGLRWDVPYYTLLALLGFLLLSGATRPRPLTPVHCSLHR